MKEKCGVFAVYTSISDVICIKDVVNGLNLLQHRGQEGCGIAYAHENDIQVMKGNGLVKDVFNQYENVSLLQMCIGHVRYSTSGKSKQNVEANYDECQPIIGNCSLGSFALVHNGNIPGTQIHDTTFLVHFIENMKERTWEKKLETLIETIPGVYCLTILTQDAIYGVRDRFGVRPLCIGMNQGDWCISSESCALHRFNHVRDVQPGEVIKIDKTGLNTVYQSSKTQLSICAFEFIYFMRPNSFTDGYYVKDVRDKLGSKLAHNEDVVQKNGDWTVVGVPDSGILAALSYAKSMGFNYIQCIEKNKNAKRTFILPNQNERIEACKRKFHFHKKQIDGQKIVVVDDTIVRGNVIKSIIHCLWECGAKEIHIRIPAPPVCDVCQLGIDIPSKEELLATGKSIEEMGKELKVCSLRYLSCDDLYDILPTHTYTECFGGGINPQMLQWG